MDSIRYEEVWSTRTDALGQQSSYGYDANGNLTSFTDARNDVTAFAYDVRKSSTARGR